MNEFDNNTIITFSEPESEPKLEPEPPFKPHQDPTENCIK